MLAVSAERMAGVERAAEEREGRSVERRVVERETDWRDRLAPPVLVLVRRLTACRSMLWLSVFNLVSGVVTAEERSVDECG